MEIMDGHRELLAQLERQMREIISLLGIDVPPADARDKDLIITGYDLDHRCGESQAMVRVSFNNEAAFKDRDTLAGEFNHVLLPEPPANLAMATSSHYMGREMTHVFEIAVRGFDLTPEIAIAGLSTILNRVHNDLRVNSPAV